MRKPSVRSHVLRGIITLWSVFALITLAVLTGCRLNRGSAGSDASSSARSEVTCPLDGAATSADAIARPPVAVMVENSPAARPQTGLDRACVVYEGITEGGITRFMAIYLHDAPTVVGPVRSARPHFIYLSNDYGASLVHCGESYEALQILTITPDRYNLDQMKFTKPFWRDTARKAPHNLYISIPKLRALMTAHGWTGAPERTPAFTRGGRLFNPSPAANVEMQFTGAVHYRLNLVYNATLGGYVRYMDGRLHCDRRTGKPLVARNVIIQYVYAEPFAHSAKGTYDVQVTGSGIGQFLTGGQAEPLRWTKSRISDPTSFTDDQGNALPLQTGQTWIELTPASSNVVITDATPPPGHPAGP